MRMNPMSRGTRVALVLFSFGLGLGLAACNDDDHNNGGARTTTFVAKQEITQNTREASEPILINDLMLSDRDTNETDQPSTL